MIFVLLECNLFLYYILLAFHFFFQQSHVKLHLATFPTGDLTKACEFIKEHVNYEEGSNVTITGMGAIPDKGKIEEALNVK